MSASRRADHVFHRDLSKAYPLAVHAEGVYIFDECGNAYLDAASGAVAANLGHGVRSIVDAMTEQARRVAFAHTLRFETPVLRDTAALIAELAPSRLGTVYFASGGSEANEAAIKLARQFHLDSGRAGKHLVIGRWQSYHGNTIGSLSAGGDISRRSSFTPMLSPSLHVPAMELAAGPRRVPGLERLPAVAALEQLIAQAGPENIAAFICEPIVGSQQGAVVPHPDYLRQVREVCDEHDIVLIVDEVMTGFGRTGKDFAVEHFGVVPDIITFGKGVTGGYAPLSGMIVHDRIVDAVRTKSNGVFRHGTTYSGHPVCVAAAHAALTYYRDHQVLDNVVTQSQYLWACLQELQDSHPAVGGLRGRGLLLGLDLYHRAGESQFTAEEFNALAMRNGAVFYPGKGAVDGVHGQHLLIAPPLTIQHNDVDRLVEVLAQTLAQLPAANTTERSQS